jgi:hypothetical protein
MAILGGSPLGLIGVKSTPSRDGMSTFNAGTSRNVNVNKYNKGNPTVYDKKVSKKDGMVSLFSGGNKLKVWGNIKTLGTELDTTGLTDNYKGSSRSDLHNNDVYDTSILNIIEKLSETPAKLRPSDFAYLKDLGRYPNNRLMIARRFGGAIGDNIINKGKGGIQAILISWKPEGEDFFEISFNEEWEDADADFTGILNEMGEDFLGKNVGGGVGGALGAIPLPGFTEGLQRGVMENLGIMKSLPTNSAGVEILPAGNPNIIKMAKKRKTFNASEKGSGLKCLFQVKMICEYEQKFISGIDPTIVWMDLLSNMLRFGTSVSSDYGLSKAFVKKMGVWSNNPSQAVADIVDALKSVLTGENGIIAKLKALITEKSEVPKDELSQEKEDREAKEEQDAANAILEGFENVKSAIIGSLESTVLKYKHDIMGVAKALSGMPSTPWHITLGNPLRPVFCAGDMLVEDVRVVSGPDLAFNDLPSRVRVEFTMKNARPWGLQEIKAKFNTGNVRSVSTVRDFSSLKAGQTLYNSPQEYGEIPKDGEEIVQSPSGVSNTAAGVDNTNSGVTTENKEVEVVNPEAGSGSDTKPVETEGETTVPTQEQAAAEAAAAAAAAAAAPVAAQSDVPEGVIEGGFGQAPPIP